MSQKEHKERKYFSFAFYYAARGIGYMFIKDTSYRLITFLLPLLSVVYSFITIVFDIYENEYGFDLIKKILLAREILYLGYSACIAHRRPGFNP